MSNVGPRGTERSTQAALILVLRLCDPVTGKPSHTQLVPYFDEYKLMVKMAASLFEYVYADPIKLDDIVLKHAVKCADGSIAWAGISMVHVSGGYWKDIVKAGNEIGVFIMRDQTMSHLKGMEMTKSLIRRDTTFNPPYFIMGQIMDEGRDHVEVQDGAG